MLVGERTFTLTDAVGNEIEGRVTDGVLRFEGIDGNKGVMQEPRWRVIPLDTKRTIGAV